MNKDITKDSIKSIKLLIKSYEKLLEKYEVMKKNNRILRSENIKKDNTIYETKRYIEKNIPKYPKHSTYVDIYNDILWKLEDK